MDKKKIIEKSVNIITEYYQNNLEPFFESMDEDMLWIGPVTGQWMQGKSRLQAAWMAESHDLIFHMRDISASYIPLGTSCCAVILQYGVTTYYPSGTTLFHDQRLHYTWKERRISQPDGSKEKQELISVIHISNGEKGDDRDNIYPIHYENVVITTHAEYCEKQLPRLHVQATDGTSHFMLPSSILYIETCDRANHCKVHARDGVILTTTSLQGFETACPEYFLRAHSSYLVNPMYVRSLKRFQCELKNGQVIPIPEKKYTRFKKAMLDWIGGGKCLKSNVMETDNFCCTNRSSWSIL